MVASARAWTAGSLRSIAGITRSLSASSKAVIKITIAAARGEFGRAWVERRRRVRAGAGDCRIELSRASVSGAFSQALHLATSNQNLATVGDQPGEPQQHGQQNYREQRGEAHGAAANPRYR